MAKTANIVKYFNNFKLTALFEYF